MTHTPGPWKAITGGADAKVVCPDGRSFLIGDIIYHDENKANANLIAAAPDMLEALKATLDVIHERDIYEQVEQAIAKAEGDNNG